MRSIIIIIALGIISLGLKAQKKQSYDQYIEDELIDYSLLLKYKDSINLTDEQVLKLKSYYEDNDFDIKDYSMKYDQSMQNLKNIIDNGKSKTEVMSVFNEILVLESEIKRNKLGFLLHSREILSDTQRKQLRLIGRTDQLTIMSNGDGYFGNYFAEIKPIYKIVNPNGTEVYVKESLLSTIDYGDIKSIDVEKGADIEMDGFKLLNQNLITIRTSRNVSDSKVKLKLQGSNSVVDFSLQPLMIIKHKGKTQILENANMRIKMQALDPDEIKSIEVTKGEKALELYGSKGKPGVVVITLKKESKYKIE